MATPLTFYIRLEALLQVVDWGTHTKPTRTTTSGGTTLTAFLDTETLRHIPGAPRQGRVTIHSPAAHSSRNPTTSTTAGTVSVVSFAVFPFADFLLSLLRGIGCHVVIFTTNFSLSAATELIAAAGWSSLSVVSVRDALPQSSPVLAGPPVGIGRRLAGGGAGSTATVRTVVLNTTHLGISSCNWSSFVIVDLQQNQHPAAAVPSYSWSSSLLPYVLQVDHLTVDLVASTVANHQNDRNGNVVSATSLVASSSSKRQQNFQHEKPAQIHVEAVNKLLRAAMTSLGLLYMLHKALRVFELFTSGIASGDVRDHPVDAALPAFGDVRTAIQLAESSLFRGVTFDIQAAGTSLKDNFVTWEATEFALRLREYGASVALLTGSSSSSSRKAEGQLDEVQPNAASVAAEDHTSLCRHFCVVVSSFAAGSSSTSSSDEENDDEHIDENRRPLAHPVATPSVSPAAMTMTANQDWVAACVDAWCILPCHSTVAFTVASLDELAELNAAAEEDDDDDDDGTGMGEQKEGLYQQSATAARVLGENVGVDIHQPLSESTFQFAHHKRLHEFLVAHLMLLLAPPVDCVDAPQGCSSSSSLPPFPRQTLHSILAECHVSSAPLEDSAFLKMMCQEVGFTCADAQQQHEQHNGEEVVCHHQNLFSGFYSRRRSAGLQSNSAGVGGSPISEPSESSISEQVLTHAKRIKETLAYEISKSISRPPRQDAATQTWVVRTASTKTMTDVVTMKNKDPQEAPSPAVYNNNSASSAITLPTGPVVGSKQPAPSNVTAGRKDTGPPVQRRDDGVLPNYGSVPAYRDETTSPRSDPLSSGGSIGFQPLIRNNAHSDAGRGDSRLHYDQSYPYESSTHNNSSHSVPNNFIVPHAARDDNSGFHSKQYEQRDHPRPPTPPKEPPRPDHRIEGMVALANATPAGSIGYAITGDFLPDFITVELPLYAYGLQLDPKTPNKALKAFVSADKRKLEGVTVQLLPAPDWFARNAPRAASSFASWCTLLLSFSSESEARLFVGDTWFHTLTGKSQKMVKLLEGETLSPVVGTTSVSSTTTTQQSTAVAQSRDVFTSAPLFSSSDVDRRSHNDDRQRSDSPRSHNHKRARSPPESHYPSGGIDALSAQLTADEQSVLVNVGSSVGQLHADPRKLELHCHKHLGSFPREQQLILSAVRKALLLQQQSEGEPAQRGGGGAHRR